MANRTVKDAHSVKGTNPQYLVEKIIRSRIYESKYWKEECFALTGEVFELIFRVRFNKKIFLNGPKKSPVEVNWSRILQLYP